MYVNVYADVCAIAVLLVRLRQQRQCGLFNTCRIRKYSGHQFAASDAYRSRRKWITICNNHIPGKRLRTTDCSRQMLLRSFRADWTHVIIWYTDNSTMLSLQIERVITIRLGTVVRTKDEDLIHPCVREPYKCIDFDIWRRPLITTWTLDGSSTKISYFQRFKLSRYIFDHIVDVIIQEKFVWFEFVFAEIKRNI
jgi:hypothetical protein